MCFPSIPNNIYLVLIYLKNYINFQLKIHPRILVFGRYSILTRWVNSQLSAATNLVIPLISFLSLFKTYNSMVFFLPWRQIEWYYNCWIQPSERNDEFSLGYVKFEVIAMQTTGHVVGASWMQARCHRWR